jgi:predicted  nucleic acid-binding Zn-ribbon protein
MAKKVSKKKEEVQEEPIVIQRPDVDAAVERRLVALYTLQLIDSEIDKIKIVRGELPRAVQDLEDEIAGLNTRIDNFTAEIKETEAANKTRLTEIDEHNEQIKKYQKQQDNVRNNREFESLNKEIEFQNLEIQLCERKNKEGKAHVSELKQHIEAAKVLLDNREKDLDAKREELTSITAETEKDEERLRKMSAEQEQFIDERYLTAYKRIRNAARNGLAVVQIDRDSCGGCFSNIPPQRQMEIKMHKKVIVCENCGRILVDGDIAAKAKAQLEK